MFDDPLVGISGLVFSVFLVVLIDNLWTKWRGRGGGDDDEERRY